MTPLQRTHVVFTLLLLTFILAVGLLWLVDVVEIKVKSRDAGPPPRLPPDTTGAKARLLVVRGLRTKWEYPIYEGHNFIGRADEKPVDIDLQPQEPDDRVWTSRQHAVIVCDGNSMTVEDLNTANGTYVNRNRVPPGKKQSLNDGDVIQIGEVHLKVLR